MIVVLTQNGLKKAFVGKVKKPISMTDEHWKDLMRRHFWQLSCVWHLKLFIR